MALIEPVLPKMGMTGRPCAWPMREIVNAVLFILLFGCPWRMLPDHFPPRSTVWDWFRPFDDECLFEGLGHRPVLADRERCDRPASPSAAVMGSQTARTSESGGPRGDDGAKRIVGRKRNALVDTDGRLLTVVVGAASFQNRDGAGPLTRASHNCFPFIERIFADRGYQGERVRRTSPAPVEILRPRPGQMGFAVQPRRWVVKKTLPWHGPNRRFWKDSETTTAASTAFLHAAAANVRIRRIALAK